MIQISNSFSLILITLLFLSCIRLSISNSFQLSADDASKVGLYMYNENTNILFTNSLEKGVAMIKDNNKFVFHYSDKTQTLRSDFEVVIDENLIIQDDAHALYFHNQKQWQLLDVNDFQQDSHKNLWNFKKVSQCGGSQNLFLGGVCQLSQGHLLRMYENLPNHEEVMIQFNFHFIDQWSGETAVATLDGQTFWTETYSWCDVIMPWFCMKYGINVCGRDLPDQMGRHVSIIAPHSMALLKLDIFTTLTKNPCDASWGIDDVQLYIR